MTPPRVPSFLAPILAAKQKEIAQAKQSVPQALLEQAAATCPPPRSFYRALTGTALKIIAEIKRASPSRGDIAPNLAVASLAQAYQAGGAVALSVLTEPAFFKGSAHDLKDARAATTLPVLRKDFIIDPYQVYESRAMGADALLLIVRILDDQTLWELYHLAHALQLAVLVEVFDEMDIQRAQVLNPPLVGINNRNLATFETDLARTIHLAQSLPPETTVLALSGIHSVVDIRLNLDAGITRFLIGEALVRQADPAQTLRRWMKQERGQ